MLIWGLRFTCFKPVEESYDKGSAFKMFKVRKSARAVVVTPFKHSKSGGNAKVHPTTQSVKYSFRITFSVAGMKCIKMLQRTYLFL